MIWYGDLNNVVLFIQTRPKGPWACLHNIVSIHPMLRYNEIWSTFSWIYSLQQRRHSMNRPNPILSKNCTTNDQLLRDNEIWSMFHEYILDNKEDSLKIITWSYVLSVICKWQRLRSREFNAAQRRCSSDCETVWYRNCTPLSRIHQKSKMSLPLQNLLNKNGTTLRALEQGAGLVGKEVARNDITKLECPLCVLGHSSGEESKTI